MPKRKNNNSRKRPDTAITVALIGLAGTIIAALLASPLIDRLFPMESEEPAPVSPQADNSDDQQTAGNRISLNQTVNGILYFDEAGEWVFNDGPARVTIILDVGPLGTALIIVRDPSGVEQAYVDEQTPGVARLVNFDIPTSGDYTILVRNTQNTQVDYMLTIQDALTPPPP